MRRSQVYRMKSELKTCLDASLASAIDPPRSTPPLPLVDASNTVPKPQSPTKALLTSPPAPLSATEVTPDQAVPHAPLRTHSPAVCASKAVTTPPAAPMSPAPPMPPATPGPGDSTLAALAPAVQPAPPAPVPSTLRSILPTAPVAPEPPAAPAQPATANSCSATGGGPDLSAAALCANLAAAELTFAESVLADAQSAFELLEQQRQLAADEVGREDLLSKLGAILGKLGESAARRRALLLDACSERDDPSLRLDGSSVPMAPPVQPRGLAQHDGASDPEGRDGDYARAGGLSCEFLSAEGIWSDLPIQGGQHVQPAGTPRKGRDDKGADGSARTPVAALSTPVASSRSGHRTPLARSALKGTPGTPSYATTDLAAATLQAVWRGRLEKLRLGGRVNKLRQRGRTAEEFIQSERAYLERLQLLVTRFFLPLQSNGLPAAELRSVFGNLQVLWNLSRSMVAQLSASESAADPPSTVCAATLRALLPSLKVYQQYVSGYHAASQKLRQLVAENPVFGRVVSEAEAKGDANERLAVLLVAPVRRLPNYGMYMERMIKLTPVDAPERPTFCQALSAVQELCSIVDASLAEHESRSRVAELHTEFNALLGPPMPHRRFLFEGEMRELLTDRGRPASCPRTVVLFNDVLMTTTLPAGSAPREALDCISLAKVPPPGVPLPGMPASGVPPHEMPPQGVVGRRG